MSKNILKETFELESKHGAYYTGGNIRWSEDGEHMFCQNGGVVSVLSVNKGVVVVRLGEPAAGEDEDTINCFTLSDDDIQVLTQHKSGLFKLWNWKENKLTKIWKSIHKGPVAQVAVSSSKSLIASGGSDGSVRLWDLQHHACTHNLKGIQGVVSVLEFHPHSEKELVFAVGDDTKIHGWNITNGREKLVLSGHFSKVTSLSFHENGEYLVSSGRDRVLILWDISSASSIRILPVYEVIEGAFVIPNGANLSVLPSGKKTDHVYAAAAGEKGVIKIWEMKSGRDVYTQENSLVPPAKEEGSSSVTHLLYNSITNSFAITSVDHNIIIHSLDTFECKKQLVGYTDEILDLVNLGKDGEHIALATNSCDIKLYNLASMNCQLLCGHTDIVLSLATTPANENLLLSSAKDNSIRIWVMDSETMRVTCVGRAERHTASVGSVSISQTSLQFFASVSQDSCLKLWEMPKNLTELAEDSPINVRHTVVAHQKDINCVTVSPNDKLIATGSQDKTAKLWSSEDLQLLGVFQGHRRGVWCVRFSPVDQVLLTTSADCTLKLWSLTGLNCLKTLEGHESSVLRAEFISRGMQLITSGGDGLLKLWNIKTSECICTLEEHDSRVWTLAVSKDEKHIISGGSDSLLAIWRDVTEEKKLEAAKLRDELALAEQRLANLLKADELTAALKLALKLERPLQVLRIVESILKKGSSELTDTMRELKPTHKEALLRCAVTWNMNSRNAEAAQIVIHAMVTEIGSEDLNLPGLSSTLEAMIPYTERHFKRLTQLLQDVNLLTYTVNCMKPHITNATDK